MPPPPCRSPWCSPAQGSPVSRPRPDIAPPAPKDPSWGEEEGESGRLNGRLRSNIPQLLRLWLPPCGVAVGGGCFART